MGSAHGNAGSRVSSNRFAYTRGQRSSRVNPAAEPHTLLRQPDIRPITQDQLVNEVKGAWHPPFVSCFAVVLC